MIEYEKIPISELEEFLHSDRYKSYEDKPISALRVKSYVNNPRADPDDNVLYMALDEGELVAYRTVLIDAFCEDDIYIKFAWYSGNWVKDCRRRQGLSTRLFDIVKDDWNGRLLYANYAPESKALYDKTGLFTSFKSLSGYRFYRRFSFEKLMAPKSALSRKNKKILSLFDSVLNMFFDLRFKLTDSSLSSKYKIEKIDELTKEHSGFIDGFNREVNSLFARGEEEHSWIKSFPWMTMEDSFSKISEQYYFSQYSELWKSEYYSIRDQDDCILGLVLINIRDSSIHIPYIYGYDCYEGISALLVSLCDEYNIDYITVYDDELLSRLKSLKFYFLFSKAFSQSFFIDKGFLEMNKWIESKHVFSGDGDGVFV